MGAPSAQPPNTAGFGAGLKQFSSVYNSSVQCRTVRRGLNCSKQLRRGQSLKDCVKDAEAAKACLNDKLPSSVKVGIGRIVALHYRSRTSYQFC